jgi:iron(II)-dependent oxidoreductase
MQTSQLIEWVREARQRTVELIEDLTDEQLIGPQLPIVNPLLWEVGHIAWFQEKWLLRRHTASAPVRNLDVDSLYDSAGVAHERRWDLPLPVRRATLNYALEVRDGACDYLAKSEPSGDDVYFALLSVFHEDMHTEAFTYTRQTLGYPPPRFAAQRENHSETGPAGSASPLVAGRTGPTGDVHVRGGNFSLGATASEPFVFDNEKWGHQVQVRPFAISRTPVTQGEFAEFVDAGGYRDERFWQGPSGDWRGQAGAVHPIYWRRDGARWLRRHFDRWLPLEPDHPMIHVNWYEAEAYCRWSSRRLPTECEWEVAAAAEPDPAGRGLAPRKRRFPWGQTGPTPERANLDWRGVGTVSVHDLPAGDSALGCRQMIGNVWEWTASNFEPYPGFSADPYKEYSAPWFGSHKILRGGCWASRGRLLRNTWRNFYRPDRRDVWAGFRTCAPLS